jgi:hypothetical protein
MRASLLAGLVLLSTLGCHPDPGLPDYSAMNNLFDAGDEVGNLAGPFPYVPGSRRLTFGIFYDGKSSQQIVLNNNDTHYYIYSATYTDVHSADRVEGKYSNQLDIPGNTPQWFGGAVTWDTPTDLSSWSTLHVSFKSSDPGFADFNVGILYGTAPKGTVSHASLKASLFGWASDGQWHHLAIPLSRFTALGATLDKARGPLEIGNLPALKMQPGETLLVDNLYFD